MRFWNFRQSINYSPFGVQLSGKNFTLTNAKEYRHGFQGSEMDNEVKGKGNSYTTEFRQLDPRLGRWLSLDPKFDPSSSPYTSMDNNPILLNDVLGLYTKDRAEKMAARAEKRGYTTTVVESRLRENDFGVTYEKSKGGKDYYKVQYYGKFRGIGRKGIRHGYKVQGSDITADPVEQNETVPDADLGRLGLLGKVPNSSIINLPLPNPTRLYSESITASIQNENVIYDDFWKGRMAVSVYSSTTKQTNWAKYPLVNLDVNTDIVSGDQTNTISLGPLTASSSSSEVTSGFNFNVGSYSYTYEISYPNGVSNSFSHTNSKGVTSGTKVTSRPGAGSIGLAVVGGTVVVLSGGQALWALAFSF